MDENEFKARLSVFDEIKQFAHSEISKRLKAKYKPDPTPASAAPSEPTPDVDPLADLEDIDSLLTE